MARKPRQTNGHTEAEPPPEAESDEQHASNCTDETRREFYRKSLMAKIALESAQATAKKKNGEYRNVLKEAKKAGVNPEAIARTLAARFQDQDALVLQLREELKMLDLGGVVPNIIEKILDRLDIEEPTRNERAQMDQDQAFDAGAFAGREGHPRDTNDFPAGTEGHVQWDKGWLFGQAAIADEMAVPVSGGIPHEPPSVIQ